MEHEHDLFSDETHCLLVFGLIRGILGKTVPGFRDIASLIIHYGKFLFFNSVIQYGYGSINYLRNQSVLCIFRSTLTLQDSQKIISTVGINIHPISSVILSPYLSEMIDILLYQQIIFKILKMDCNLKLSYRFRVGIIIVPKNDKKNININFNNDTFRKWGYLSFYSDFLTGIFFKNFILKSQYDTMSINFQNGMYEYYNNNNIVYKHSFSDLKENDCIVMNINKKYLQWKKTNVILQSIDLDFDRFDYLIAMSSTNCRGWTQNCPNNKGYQIQIFLKK